MTTELALCIAAVDVGGLAAGAWLCLRGARGSSRDLARLALLGAVLLPLGFALGLTVLHNGFAVLRLWCHALFCVLTPVAMARGLQRRGAFGLALAATGLLAEGAYLFARHVEPYRLEVTHHDFTSERLAGLARPLRVAVLADLQTDALGPFEERVFAALDAERADLVLIPGDLLQLANDGSVEYHERQRDLLKNLFTGLRHRPRLGFVMVGGDCEPFGVGIEDTVVQLLENETLAFPEDHLQVIGLTRASSRRPVSPELAAAARDFPGLTIVMGHAPEFALSSPDIGVPVLCIAGHTHGGQVQLPFFGPPFTLSAVPRAYAAGGLHRLGDGDGAPWLCVSRGIGMERGHAPRIRFLCRPELVVFDLDAPAVHGSL